MGLWKRIARIANRFRVAESRRAEADEFRRCRFEAMEARRMLSADPIRMGAVYIEEDLGSDLHGDTFEITFVGGAAGTQLTRVVIDGDQSAAGFGDDDVFFDTEPGGLGADHALPFQVVSLQTKDPTATVRASVVDGTSRLTLDFTNFQAGDKLVFSIDVDEVEHFDPAETDLSMVNDGFDPITSGVEFQSSKLQAFFRATHFHDVSGETEFRNRYDDLLINTGLDLPADNAGGKRDRSDGAVMRVQQTPLPVTISGSVFLDNNLNLVRDAGEQPISNVAISLWRQDGDRYIDTGHTTQTSAGGTYHFGTQLNLLPGVYQVRESQPAGVFSVGAIPGTVDGSRSGSTVAGNHDVLTEITIAKGGLHSVDNDFAEANPAQLSGYVFHDRSNDGLRDAQEEGIGGVTLVIEPVQTIAPQAARTVTTDANGFYETSGLAPGTYRVRESAQPTGYFDGLDRPGTVAGVAVGRATNPGDLLESIVLAGGQAGIEYNFGELLPGSIRGQVRLTDKDGNCSKDHALTQPVPDAVVRLFDSTGKQIAETRTNARGEYQFAGLQPGTYRVEEVTPAGLIDGGEHLGTVGGQQRGTVAANDSIAGIRIGSSEQAVDYDFCEHQPASISGFVYHDVNQNGLRDPGEEPISGVEVELRDAQGRAAGQTTTNAAGFYQFTQLSAGSYTLVEKHPAGWLDGIDSVGTVDGAASGVAGNETLQDVALGWGQTGLNYNFGELRPASIRGHVRLTDKDGNCGGTHDASRAIPNAVVRLFDATDRQVAETRTNAQGEYEFTGLLPGLYRVVEITPAGLIDGAEHVGKVAGQVRGTTGPNDTISGIRLGSGEQAEEYDFCEHEPSSLSGFVYHDANQNGVRELAEEPIAGTQVELRDAQGALVARTTTNAVGFYRFDQLRAGTYVLVEKQPDGWLDGRDSSGFIAGTPVGVAGNDRLELVAIGWGQAGVEYNFGELLPGSIAGQVHLDRNRNCEVDPGEVMLEGVTIQLLDATGEVLRTTLTDRHGRYRFSDVAPGTYGIREIQPAQAFHGDQHVGSGGGLISIDDLIEQIEVRSGLNLIDYNFCEVPPARLAGFVFQDGGAIATNDGLPPSNLGEVRDGKRTADDRPISGVLLQLRDGFTGHAIDASEALPGTYAAGPIQVRTDAQGRYEFRNIPGGRSYAVYEIQPEGFFDGIDTVGTTTGFAFNPQIQQGQVVLEPLAGQPAGDAIIRIAVQPGQASENNNFSEVRVETAVIPPPPPPPPLPPLPPPPSPPLIRREIALPALNDPAPTFIVWSAPRLPIYHEIAGSSIGYTWHLSVVNGGMPRDITARSSADALTWRTATYLEQTRWQPERLSEAEWMVGVLPERSGLDAAVSYRILFGMRGATPVSGDFNGDGKSDLAVFYRGEWFIDLNGNGQWDEGDLWARLGDELDRPVVGDWDGDGKDDIGIYGPEWFGDQRQIDRETGLPDSHNTPDVQGSEKPKNVPPNEADATDGRRLLRLTAEGPRRSDVIDHVFRYGAEADTPVAGDWNGDGIRTIGTFTDGKWRVDTNGDGHTTRADQVWHFGKSGDIPIVGDWDGNGVEEIGVYRRGQWILDVNGNRELDAHDRVFELGGSIDRPVVGDWNGDGTDDPAVFRDAGPGDGVPVSR